MRATRMLEVLYLYLASYPCPPLVLSHFGILLACLHAILSTSQQCKLSGVISGHTAVR